MVDTNKILTVSYGTFSCTLEGFDDSFGTMKAIAEYFRDLAADDRYFGAEPPTPDAEMLARIAEKEIARRVEARMEENSIVLRADHGSILPVAAAAAQTAEAPAQDAPAQKALTEDAPAPATSARPDAEPVAEDDLTDADSLPADAAPVDAPVEAPVETAPQAAAPAALADMPAQELTTQEEDSEAEEASDVTADAPQATAPVSSAPAEELYDDDSGDISGDISGDFSTYTAPQAFTAPAADPIPSDEPVDSVAAKLRRIRAVVSQEAKAGSDPLFNEDEHADDFLSDTHEEIEAALAIDDEAELASDAPAEDGDDSTDSDIAALLDRFGADDTAKDAAPADVMAETPAEPEVDAPAETLEEAPVEALEETPVEPVAEDLGEDLDSDSDADFDDDLDGDLAGDDAHDALFDPEEFISADDSAGDPFDAADTGMDSDSADLAPTTDTAATDTAATDEQAAPADDLANAGPVRARIIKMKRAVFNAAIASGDLEEEADGSNDDPADDTSLSAEEEAELRNELAAVEAELVEPQDDYAADLTGLEDDYEEIDDDDGLSARLHGLLNDDNGADDGADNGADDVALADDTIHVDDFAAGDDGDNDDDNIFGAADDDGIEEGHAQDDVDTTADQDQQAAKNAFKADAEDEMGRIFAEADNQMDEESGKGRRNAIAHLRAAVAAAKAEESAGKTLNDNAPDTLAYRDDLESVVRPRRPQAVKTRTRRPETARPAPLKLVAEQRVDVEDSGAKGPVRPRRVDIAATAGEAQVSEGEFADYAESVGANSLPELLEAAAAYLSFVEGREQFSRPQLMTQVRKVEKDEFSREDGLRSFGQLLREGKIEKLEGGRFKASDSISYRPDARYAGE